MQVDKGAKVLIFIDIETTGLEENDKICSIAVIDPEARECKYELVNEGKKIPSQASSVHHITNEMIKGKPAFKGGEIYEFLLKNNSEENTLVAHNVKFDLRFLASSGLAWKGDAIDTSRIVKHLIPECEFISLQSLRYELKLYKNEELEKQKYGIKDAIIAHNALSDALVDKTLFDYLLDMASVDEMKELSFKNALVQKFNFGKHKGKYVEEICSNDRGYVEWALSSDMDEDIKYSINYYLQGSL
jgi:DNA polymerase III epsilon subunit-like protein